MTTQSRLLAALCGFALLGFAAPATAVSVEPGQWDMTVSLTMPMLPQPQVRTNSQCITPEQAELDPESFSDENQGDCETTNFEKDGNTVRWEISCPGPGGTTSGKMEFTSHGDTLEGKGVMSMDMQGQAMDMSMTWTGKRTGECEAAQ